MFYKYGAAQPVRAVLSQFEQVLAAFNERIILRGREAISDFIEKLQREDPAFEFSVAKPIESVQNGVRLYGHINTGQGRLDSMDFFILENGKVLHL